ncbi:MAG: hypothetical protein GY811_10345 [Myxococcales bacterium]|nr:hypothetical protein [Myxococcales bacterium]
MSAFSTGLYLSDYYLEGDSLRVVGARQLSSLISWFAGGRTHFPVWDDEALIAALADSGLSGATPHVAGDFARELQIERPRRSAFVRVIEAQVERP